MAINVYGWRKPTLELELVEGGSLLANTKYYVTGFMRFTPITYNAVSSPFADVVEITTTSTARSIKITQKTYRDITAFASAGAGVTTVTSTRHCLKTGDVIKIDTGSYAGTWTITKVDANTFTIPTAYVDDVAVQCYTDSVYYNKPAAGNVYMMYYVDTLNPYDANGTFLRRPRWLEQVHQYTYGSQNPVIVTARPTTAGTTGGTMNLKHSLFDNGVYKEVCDDYGLIYIEVIDDVVSLLNIHTAVQNSGFIQNTHLTSISNAQEFTLIGSMAFSNTAALTLNGATLNYICSEVFHRHNAALLTYTGCLINLMPVSFTAQMLSTMNNCVFYNSGTSNNYGWVYGDDTIFYALPRPSYVTNQCDIPNLKYNNLETGGQNNYGIIQNKIYRDTGQDQVFQTSYNQSKLINCTVPSVYWLSLYGTGCRPDIYMMENCTINRSTLNWHYRLTTDSAGSYYNHHFKYLNINVVAADNNIKKCIHNYVVQEGAYLQADFYRRLKLYISNQSGEAIENATINIADNADNIYTGTTDASGYTYIDCLEQKTRFDGYNNSMSNWNPIYDTYYSGFTITVSKEGYTTEKVLLSTLYQTNQYDTVFNISLHGASYPKSRIVNATA